MIGLWMIQWSNKRAPIGSAVSSAKSQPSLARNYIIYNIDFNQILFMQMQFHNSACIPFFQLVIFRENPPYFNETAYRARCSPNDFFFVDLHYLKKKKQWCRSSYLRNMYRLWQFNFCALWVAHFSISIKCLKCANFVPYSLYVQYYHYHDIETRIVPSLMYWIGTFDGLKWRPPYLLTARLCM